MPFPEPPFPFAAALIAGGRSRRMGRDKALLEIAGRSLWQRQLDTLRACGASSLLVSVRADQDWPSLPVDVRRVIDPPEEDAGPLGGIVRTLEQCGLPLLVLAVDMPAMTSNFLSGHLLAAAADGRIGVIPRTESCFEPLCALYTPVMLPAMREALAWGRVALQPLVGAAIAQGHAKSLSIEPRDWAMFRNVNTPEEWRASDATPRLQG